MKSRKHHPLATTVLIVAIFLLCSAADLGAAAGDLYVSSFGTQDVVRISPDGTQALVVGNLVGPTGMAFDSKGILYVGQYDGTVVKIINGAATPFASGMATQSFFGLAFDKFGTLHVTESKNGVVTRIAPDGTKTIHASGLLHPNGIAFDTQGNFFVSTFGASVNEGIIYKYTPTGRTTFASAIKNSGGLAFDAAGNLYGAEAAAGTISKYTPAGAKSTFATVHSVRYLAFDPAGNLYAADNISTISKVTPNGTVSSFKSINSVSGLAIEPSLSQPLNISTRVNVQTGDNALIGGFIATGTATKKLMVRAIGPSLASFGVPGSLQDTTLEVRAANGSVIATNDNWKINAQTNQSQQAAIQATGLAPSDDRESALMIEVAPAGFTAVVRGKNNTTGVGLVEIYDLNQTTDSRLANISTRGVVGTDANVMIGGFIVGSGNGAAKLMIRAIGPSLTNFGVSGALSDPMLSLRDSNGSELASDDDWGLSFGGDDSRAKAIENTGLAPSDIHESAILTTLPNGNYTAIVAGYQGGTGVGLVEVYNLR
jgi:hypothetical protein